MEKALSNLVVLDLTRVLAGPFCTMILADQGAEVIKVEMPNTGDDSRQFGPFINGESGYFMSINRNKRSITINLKENKGKEILKDLVKQADVIVENYRPGTMEKLGLGYDVLKEINPGLIYAACSGFGHSGPYSQRPAYDGVVQAMGGIMSITGQKNGEPTRVGPSIGDIMAGNFTAIGILSALNYRKETGKGQKVDVAMFDCQVAILENAIARYYATGSSPAPAGNKHTSIVPFEPFDTSDGKIMVAAGNDNLWAKYCNYLNRSDLINDPRFKTNPLRNENYDELREILTEEMLKRTTEEWKNGLVEAGVPSGPINNVEMVVNDEQIKSRNMIQEVEHKIAGKTKLPGNPIKYSDFDDKIDVPAPVLGEHTDEILKELLKYSDEQISQLHKDKIV